MKNLERADKIPKVNGGSKILRKQKEQVTRDPGQAHTSRRREMEKKAHQRKQGRKQTAGRKTRWKSGESQEEIQEILL